MKVFGKSLAMLKQNLLYSSKTVQQKTEKLKYKFETNQDLQQIASRQLAILLAHARIRSPNPIPKIFKNILTYLSNDPVRTPVLQLMSSYKDFSQTPGKDPYENNRYYGILSDKSYVPPSNANGNGN